jgi:hypothetical protein
MSWFKVSAIAAGVLIGFLVISSVIGFIVEAAIVAIAVAAIVFGVKAAFSRREVTRRQPVREVGQPAAGPAPSHVRQRPDVEDELTRLRREMRDMQ